MSYQINVEPGGLSFRAEPGESLLDEALRAGVPLDFGCNSGTCGECRLRLVEGELLRHRVSDFALSAAEQSAGWFLACSQEAASDLQINAPVVPGTHLPTVETVTVQVQRFTSLSNSVDHLRLRMPRQRPLHFLPGQQVELANRNGSLGHFSIASCPCDGQFVELHLCRGELPVVDDGHLFARGKAFTVRGPLGGFADAGEIALGPKLFIAWQTGFAAIKGLIEQLIVNEWQAPYHLIWMASREDGWYLENQCRAWSDAVDAFSFETVLCDSAGNAASACSAELKMGGVQSSAVLHCLQRLNVDNALFESAEVYAAVPEALKEGLVTHLPANRLNFPVRLD